MKEAGWAVSGEGAAVRERDGSWWPRPSSRMPLVDASVASSLSAVLVVRRLAPVVVRLLSFVRSCPSFACFAARASGMTHLGRGTGKALAVNCPLAVNGGHVMLVGRLGLEDRGTYFVWSIRRRRPYRRRRRLHRHCCHVAWQALVTSFAASGTVGHARRPFVAGGGRWQV